MDCLNKGSHGLELALCEEGYKQWVLLESHPKGEQTWHMTATNCQRQVPEGDRFWGNYLGREQGPVCGFFAWTNIQYGEAWQRDRPHISFVVWKGRVPVLM